MDYICIGSAPVGKVYDVSHICGNMVFRNLETEFCSLNLIFNEKVLENMETDRDSKYRNNKGNTGSNCRNFVSYGFRNKSFYHSELG